MNEIQFGVSNDFWKSVNKLPIAIRGKVMDLWNRMRSDPWDMKHHPEKVKEAKDDRIWSARVDDDYRLIWAHIQVRGKSDQIVFLYVDKHDAAYKKAERMKFRLEDGMVKVVDLVETISNTNISNQPETNRFSQQRKSEIGKLFIGYSDQELLDCGVPEEMLPYVRRLDTDNELDQLSRQFPDGVYDNLVALLVGEPEYIRVPNAQLHRSLEKYHGGDNLHIFVNSEEFKRVLKGEWEDWMLFLAPDQRRLVYTDYTGPARVKGVVGSGKTVVAIHRALHLARTIGKEGDILFLTYGNRLPGVVSHLLARLAGENAPELEAIECLTIHKWCYRMLVESGETIQVAEKTDFSNAIQSGIRDAKQIYPNLKLWGMGEQFFLDEIRYAIKGRAISNFEQYAMLERSGRGTALSETERKAMWQVYLGYQRYLNQKGLWDYEDYILKALEFIKAGKILERYKAAIIDEIQDLNAATMMMIRAIVEPGPNDLFLVGDGLQKLYPGGYVLSKLGIDIVGRGIVLKRNYRNTQQILRAAYAMIQNRHFNDLDGEDSTVEEPEFSPRTGEHPVIKGFSTPEKEIGWIQQEIERLKREQGYQEKDFAVLYRWKYLYHDLLLKMLYPCMEITNDPSTYFGPCIKITTFDSAKGLEFKVVFLVGVTDAIMVPKDDLSLEGVGLEEYLTRERSRLFVAMTRARDLLYITYSRGQLSRFLAGIPNEYLVRK